jgi:predicted alpha/beta superfamily hydrolase
MKCFLFVLFGLFVVAAKAQSIKGKYVVMGTVDSVFSKNLKEKRKFWVYVPATANDKAYTQQKYPVVYLLDGEDHFPSVTGMIQQLSEVNGNMICPDMIVVAISNTDRTRDLTPSNSTLNTEGKTIEEFKTSGGNEPFIAFIQRELMPHIDSIYPTAPYKLLIGHSFGALTAMNILINHTNLFNSYLIIDPSMWWDHQKLLTQARADLPQKKFNGKSVYLAIANTMPDGMDTLQVRKDTSGRTAHIRSILALADVFKANPNNGLNFKYRYYQDDNHGSVPLIATYDALHFLFGYYKLPPSDFIKVMDANNNADAAAIISAHYADISRHMGYMQLPPENMVNELAYYYLQSNNPQKAFLLFALNIQNYPESFNAYDSMGDYYSFRKDKEKTITYYRKALKISNVPDTREKLRKVMEGK